MEDEVLSVLQAAVTVENDTKKIVEPELKEKITEIQFLLKFFSVLDLKLKLYFTNHSSAADLDKLLAEISKIVKKKLSIDRVLQILYLYPESFVVQETTSGRYLIDLPKIKLDGLESRKLKFGEALREWEIKNKDEPVPCATVKDIITDPFNNRVRVLKHGNKRLKNNALNFEFQERKEISGGSLLDRIRAKEKLKQTEASLPMPQKLDSKLHTIYDILYSLQMTERVSNYTLPHLTQIIKDSYPTSIHAQDINDSLQTLSNKLPAVELVTKNKLTVIKLTAPFDRKTDRNRLDGAAHLCQ